MALGASAGGLDALRRLLSRVDPQSGVAFVVIQHLDPERPSILTSVLEGHTSLPVVEATTGMALEPNRVHVIPSSADLSVGDGVLSLVPRQRTGGLHLPIDAFFRALAVDAKARAVGVVLSGSGADGTEGLRAIKTEGGIAAAQEPESAEFQSMPEAAIASGVVDFRGTPEEIAAELMRLSRHPYVTAEGPAVDLGPGREKVLASILTALRRHADIDFNGYKRTTVLRRIDRRMALRHVDDLGEYARQLSGDPEEARALARDMLIHVTAFFRDPDAFDALKQTLSSALASRGDGDDSIRVWVPGCSTGEEVYGVTMSLLETLDQKQVMPNIKIFGTDLSEDAIEVARQGVYPEAALVEVSAERRARFFEKTERGYRIIRRVRDLCVFVKHDLTCDPPFAKLDLISCRNVLIYFDAELQRRVIPMLHYCLRPGGYLFLGQSETIAGFRDLFERVDEEHRIFVKSGDSVALLHPLRAGRDPDPHDVQSLGRRSLDRGGTAREAQRQADHLMLTRYAPPGVIVNGNLDIIQFRGRTGTYLEPPPGQPQANLLRMARGELAAHLHEAVERAKSEDTNVRKDGLRFRFGSEVQVVNVEIAPLASIGESAERYFLVLFEPAGLGQPAIEPEVQALEDGAPSMDTRARDSERVKAELTATKDYLQSLISEHQSTTDELATANEELVAANEELQSINEELQSAKEELQSTNEELITVNDQLRHRNLELDRVANDLVNVLASVEIPVIIVDLDLRVRRYTPTVRDIARFIPEDIGRPIDDLAIDLEVDDLPDRIRSVLHSATVREWEVRGKEGRWFRMQIRPYHTSEDELDGAVLSFVDVDALRRSVEEAESARDYARSIVETIRSALVVLDAELRVVSANTAFYEAFSLSPSDTENARLSDLSAELWSLPALRAALERTLQRREGFTGLELETELPRVGLRMFSLAGRPILWGRGAPMALLALDDVTSLRSLERQRDQLLASEKQARVEAERATRAKDLFLATLSHELRTPLSTVLISAQLLRQLAPDNPQIERPSAAIERAASAQAKLIDDLLDVSRIVSGKLMLDLGPVDLEDVVRESVDAARPSALAKGLELQLEVEGISGAVYGDEVRLLQVVSNLLTNAIKFTPRGGQIWVRLVGAGDHVELSVTDTGMGISAEVRPRLFDRFVQADGAMTRTHGGLGLGLSIVRHLVEVHGGTVDVESPGEGRGTTFRIRLPAGHRATATAPVEPRADARSIEGVRVLLVEDDEDTREAYAAMLLAMGTRVRAEPSAASALVAVGEFHPDVILSDIAMPGEDGFTFMSRVRHLRAEEGGLIPAAALTALASDEDRRRALDAGFQLHVPKPVTAARLATVVAALLDSGTRVESAGER